MGLAASQSRYLFLTTRKADCEYNITINSMRKMQYTREMSQLSQEYNSKLSQKKLAFYANGEYNKVNYRYLMGDRDFTSILNENPMLKDNNSMILADYKGQVVLSNTYANAIMSVLGTSIMNDSGQGGTFSENNIPEILHALMPAFSADEYENGIASHTCTFSSYNAITGEYISTSEVDNSGAINARVQSIVNFYYPIFLAAACNGWTTEYNEELFSGRNDDYIQDSIIAGTFQLATVDQYGAYESGTSLTYYVTTGDLEMRNDSDAREELTAWYNAEKDRITAEETMLDLTIENLSAELEAVNTEMQSVKSLIDDAMNVFNWCGQG